MHLRILCSKKPAILASSIAIALISAGGMSSRATTFDGNGQATGTTWNSGINWDSGLTPQPTDALLINAASLAAGTSETLDASFTVQTLSFDTPTGSTLSIDANSASSGVTTPQTLTLTGGTNALGTTDLIDVSATSGTINLGTTSGVGTLGIVLGTDGNFNVNGSAVLNFGANSTISGGFSLSKSGNGTLILAAGQSYTGTTTINGGTLQLGDGVTSNGSVAGGIVTNASLVVANPFDQTMANAISGTGSLAKTGAGNLTLSTVASYSGGTTINQGTLTLTQGGVTGNIRGTLTINSGGTVVTTVSNAFGYGGGVKVDTLNINGGTLNDTASGDQGWGITINLTGGKMQSNGGTASATATQLFSLGGGSSVNTLASSTTSTIAGRINIRENNANNQLVFTTAQGTTSSNIDLNVSAVITAGGAYGITKNGPGTMQLSAINTFTGPVIVNGGTLTTGTAVNNGNTALGAVGAANASRTITINSGATMSWTVNNVISGGGNTVGNLPSIIVNGGTFSSTRYNAIGNLTLNGGTLTQNASDSGNYQGFQYLGTITVGGTSPSYISSSNGKANHLLGGTPTIFNVADATGDSAADLIVSNPMTNGSGDYGGVGSLQKTGAGTMQLTGVSNYTGATNVNAGTLAIAGGGSLGATTITVASGATLDVSGVTSGNFGITSTQPINILAGGSLVGAATVNSGTLMLNPGGSMTGALTVGATGSLVAGHLSGTTADISGSLSNSGTINIAGAGTAGTLTVGGNVTLNGGTVNFDLAALASATSDLVNSVNLTLTGTTTIAVNKLGTALGSGTYTLFNYSGTLTGDTSNLTLSGVVGGTSRQTFTLGTTGSTNGSVTLTVAGTAANLTWKGDGSANIWDLITTANFLNGSASDKYYDGDNVVFNDSGSNSPTITLTGTLSPNSVTVSNSAEAYTFGGSGSISGGTGLTKNGNGMLTIQTTNSFTGPVAINSGTVSVATIANGGTSSGLGAGTSISLGGATNTGDLQYTGVTASTNRILSLNAGGGVVEVTSAATTLTETGVVSGSGSLTKLGNGVLVLAATNTYSGKTTVNGGTLQIGTGTNAGSLGAGSVNIGGAGTLAFDRSDNGLTIPNILSGTGTVNFNGTGTSLQSGYILTGDNSGFSGTINATNARVWSNNAPVNVFGTATLVTGTNGQFYLTGGTFANNFMISGAGWVETLGQAGAIRLQSNATISGAVTLTGPATITAYQSSGTISGPIRETGGSQSLTFGIAGQAGTINLTGASTYTGATSILNGATVNLGGRLGATAVTVADGATFGGHGTIGTGGSLTLGTANGAVFGADSTTPGALSVNGNVTLNGTNVVALAPGAYLSTGAPYTLMTYTGSLTGSSANLSLANSGNYRQAVFSAGGGQITVDIGAKALTWTGASGGNWDATTTSAAGTQSWNDTTSTQQSFWAGDAVTFDDSASSANTAVTLVGTLVPQSVTFNNSSNNYVFSGTTGSIGGSTSLTLNGSGSVTLQQAETFTGAIVVNNGTLIVAAPNGGAGVLGNSSGLTINGGQVLVNNDNALEGGNNAKPITIYTGGELNIAAGATTHIAGILTLKGGTLAGPAPTGSGANYGDYNLDNTVVAGGVADTSEISAASVALTRTGGTIFTVNSGATSGIDLDVSGNFTNTPYGADMGLIKAGNGVMQLSGTNNTYKGPTTVNAGTLSVTGAVTASPVTVNGGTFSVASTGTVGGTVTVSSGTAVVSGALNGSTVNVNGGSFTVASGGNVSNQLFVTGGTAVVATSGTISGPVTLSGGRFGGSGLVTGPLTVNVGGTLAPGVQSTPTFISLSGGLALNSGGHVAFNLASAGSYDQILVSGGSVTLGGDIQLSLGYTPAVGDVFYLIVNQGGSPVTGTFSNVADLGNGTGQFSSGGVTYLVSYTAAFTPGDGSGFAPGQGNDIALKVLTVVPEPASASMLVSGFGLLLGLRRFRSRRA